MEAITLAHKYAMPAENLGFYLPDYGYSAERSDVAVNLGESAKPDDKQQRQDDADSEQYEQSIQADIAEEMPVDVKDGEPLQEDRIVPVDEEEAVVYIDGTALTIQSSLRALRGGCESFGLSKRGSKQMCLKRMLDHLQTQTPVAAHGAEVRLKSEAEREARAQHSPKAPSPEEIQQHNLTHEPYKDWCEICVNHRARQDAHVKSSHEQAGHSVVSYDFCFCTRMPGEDDKQTVLVLHDRGTKLVHAIPTLQKGGRQLQYLVTEFVRFIMHTQHKEVAIRSDLEPSNLALADGIRRTCRGLGIVVHHEPIVKREHQSVGAAESTLQQLRLKAGMLICQIEHEVAADRLLFPCTHPLFGWALLHAAWLHNRFVVNCGSTAYERSADCVYTGRLCLFGEVVLGYLKASRKAAPRWTKVFGSERPCQTMGTSSFILKEHL